MKRLTKSLSSLVTGTLIGVTAGCATPKHPYQGVFSPSRCIEESYDASLVKKEPKIKDDDIYMSAVLKNRHSYFILGTF